MSNYQTLADVQAAIQAGETSCANLVEGYLKRIDERASINAFVETYADEARNRAREIDTKLTNGTAGKLAGMVIGLKDNIVYKGHKVTASSKILTDFESLFSATVVERLLAEDAIIIGRLSCDEFAMGSSNEHSTYGPVKNPLDETRVPGGSSGGSAAAVAAGLCHAALGSDTGGSIRQPASFTGTIGLKPTYGRVSRYGLIAYGSSLDQIGPFTKTVEDAALLLEVMAGADDYDGTVSHKPVDAYVPTSAYAEKAKIVYIREAAEHPGLSEDVRNSFNARVEKLRSLDHTVEPVDFPYLEQVVPTYYIISNAEASSNLSRYDGIRFGYRSAETTDIESAFVKSRSEGFGAEVKRRVMLGTFVLSAGYYDAYYTKAQKVRRLIRNWTYSVFENADFIITPTSPHAAFKFGSKTDDPVAMYLEDIFTVHANLSGIPGISIPMGTNKENMPLGLQLMTPAFEEAKLLSFAKYCVDEL